MRRHALRPYHQRRGGHFNWRNRPPGTPNRANQLWHTDSSFKATPALASVLSARTIPEDGGETEFVSTRLAWDRLSDGQREELRDLVVVHSYATSRDQIDPALMTPVERAALPPVRWRLTWRNPANARDALYIASHAGAIEGMEDARSRALLARLIDEATQTPHVYSHRWRAGDVILWDNRATMHRGRPWPGTQARLMVCTTISARYRRTRSGPTKLITHPVTFAFVADRNPLTPVSTARSAITANVDFDLRPECVESRCGAVALG